MLRHIAVGIGTCYYCSMTAPRIAKVDPHWIDRFRAIAHEQRIPLTGMLELTSRCNLRCQHCYIGSQEEQHRHHDKEMDTRQVCDLIDEIAASGCLYFTITGGDPMMRKDFPDIYRHARSRGLLVTVFCDAILVNDCIIELFNELPPHRVEVSIYGATPRTYETITRVTGSFDKAITGIHRLIDHGFNVTLKTVLMTLNEHELEDMRSFAETLGCRFYFDGAIFPCLHTEDDSPVNLRLPAETVIRHEMSTLQKRQNWVNHYDRIQSRNESDQLYTCAAGQTSFYIDPQARLSPCIMTNRDRHESYGRSFQEVWDSDLGAIRKRKSEQSIEPHLRGACNTCAAFNQVETGDENIASEYGRELTRARYRAIMEAKQELSQLT